VTKVEITEADLVVERAGWLIREASAQGRRRKRKRKGQE
jgi:hypothetical protein